MSEFEGMAFHKLLRLLKNSDQIRFRCPLLLEVDISLPPPTDAGAVFVFFACSVIVFAHGSGHDLSWRWS